MEARRGQMLFYLTCGRLNLKTYSSGGHQQVGHPHGGQGCGVVGDLPPARPDVAPLDLQQFEPNFGRIILL